MNSYHLLFLRLSKFKPNILLNAEQYQDLGFFSEDISKLAKEGYIFIEEKNEPCNVGILTKKYIKLAPKGFSSLEQYSQQKAMLNATIIVAIATALGIFINLFVFLMNSKNPSLITAISLSIFGVIISALTGFLFSKIWPLIFPPSLLKKSNKKRKRDLQVETAKNYLKKCGVDVRNPNVNN